LPIAIANKLGDKVAVLWSDADKAIAIRKAADGDFKLKSVGKNKTTKSLYAKSLIEVKKIKPARYNTTWDEKNQMCGQGRLDRGLSWLQQYLQTLPLVILSHI
jgi:hypothetical protein